MIPPDPAPASEVTAIRWEPDFSPRVHPLARAPHSRSESPELMRAYGARLWSGLVSVALAEEEDDALAATGPTAVARGIMERWSDPMHGQAYCQVVVDYLQQIVEELSERDGRVMPELRNNVSQVVISLSSDVVVRVLDVGEPAHRSALLAHAVRGLTQSAASRLIEVATRTWNEPGGASLLTTLDRSTRTGEDGDVPVAVRAPRVSDDVAFRASSSSIEGPTAERSIASEPQQLALLLAAPQVDWPQVDAAIATLGLAAAKPLMDALIGASERGVRAKLLDRVVCLGPSIAPFVLARLSDDRWFVQRNALTILSRLPAWPDGWTPHNQSRSRDPRVRREAYKMLFKTPALRDRAVVEALHDTDESNVAMALGVCRSGCPKEALRILLAKIADQTATPHVRVLAVRALASVRDSQSLETLLGLTLGRRTLLGRPRLALKSPEMLAALAGLSRYWEKNERAAQVLALADTGDDSEVRAAAAAGAQARPNGRAR